MPRRLPPIQLPPTDNVGELRDVLQRALNDIVDSLSVDEHVSEVDCNNQRIVNVGRCTELHDAVNLECLFSHLEPLRKKRRAELIPTRPPGGDPDTPQEFIGTGALRLDLATAIFAGDFAGGNQHALFQHAAV